VVKCLQQGGLASFILADDARHVFHCHSAGIDDISEHPDTKLFQDHLTLLESTLDECILPQTDNGLHVVVPG